MRGGLRRPAGTVGREQLRGAHEPRDAGLGGTDASDPEMRPDRAIALPQERRLPDDPPECSRSARRR